MNVIPEPSLFPRVKGRRRFYDVQVAGLENVFPLTFTLSFAAVVSVTFYEAIQFVSPFSHPLDPRVDCFVAPRLAMTLLGGRLAYRKLQAEAWASLRECVLTLRE